MGIGKFAGGTINCWEGKMLPPLLLHLGVVVVDPSQCWLSILGRKNTDFNLRNAPLL
jgi:hypothetical protein